MHWMILPLRRYAEAREETGKALAILRRKLPAYHPLVIASLAQLGLAEYAQHETGAAKAHWDEALEQASRTLRPESPELAKLHAMIANPDALLANSPE